MQADINMDVNVGQRKVKVVLFHILNFKSRYSRGEETTVQRDKVTLS